MQGKQKIIDDILQSARKSAAAMIDEATAEADASVKAVREELDAARVQADADIKAAADAVYAGRLKLGELEAGKIILKSRQDCVSAVYDKVRGCILSLKDDEYLKLLGKLIGGVCSDGDEIIAARADAKRVTAAWIKKLSTSLKVKLTLSKEVGDFDGGVILRNEKFDRDLTVDEIVSELRERTEADTVKKLGVGA